MRVVVLPLRKAPIELWSLTRNHRSSWMRRWIKRAQENPRASVWAVLGYVDDELVGWAGVSRWRRRTEASVFVRWRKRRNGYGTALLQRAYAVAAERWPGQTIWAGPSDKAGNKTFAKCGFVSLEQ